MKIGIIGTGNMGKILIEAFIESHAIAPSSLTITNRTIEKAIEIKNHYPDITVSDDPQEVIKRSELIFICVKPAEFHPLLSTLSPYLSKEKGIVSITSPIKVSQLEQVVECSVARVIPSITNRALSGVSLLTFGESCHHSFKEYIENLFKNISTPIIINDDITRISSDIVSCGPAFFSYLLQRFVEAAVKETKISRDEANEMASKMIIGLGKLLESGLYTLPTLQEKVCVKGGITGEGIHILEDELGEIFEHLFQATHKKYDEDIEKISKQFTN